MGPPPTPGIPKEVHGARGPLYPAECHGACAVHEKVQSCAPACIIFRCWRSPAARNRKRAPYLQQGGLAAPWGECLLEQSILPSGVGKGGKARKGVGDSTRGGHSAFAVPSDGLVRSVASVFSGLSARSVTAVLSGYTARFLLTVLSRGAARSTSTVLSGNTAGRPWTLTDALLHVPGRRDTVISCIEARLPGLSSEHVAARQ